MSDDIKVTQDFGSELDKGRKRENNEDSLGTAKIKQWSEDESRSIGIYMVADGIGGSERGEEASKLAVQTAMNEMLTHINEEATDVHLMGWLVEAAQQAHHAIRIQNQDTPKSGTTLVMAAVIAEKVYIVNIGDSRAYVIANGKLRKVTHDHTMAQALADAGIITEEEIDHHPNRHVLYQAVGVDAEMEPDLFVETLQLGDYLLLCSDGLYSEVASDEIVHIVTEAESPQAASKQLTQAANDAGGDDNIAVVVVKIRERTH
jgi:protein phosphatase